MFSYRFPGLGPSLVGPAMLSVADAQDVARLLTEVAQLNSERLEAAVRKVAPGAYDLLENADTWTAISYETRDEVFIDDEDRLCVSRYFGGLHQPAPLTLLATEGLVEVFFGALTSEGPASRYNPDDHWTLLLDLW